MIAQFVLLIGQASQLSSRLLHRLGVPVDGTVTLGIGLIDQEQASETVVRSS